MPARPTVVVVDDDDAFRRLAAALLTSQGFDVVAEASDGEAGLAAVLRLRPHCLLLDVNLPGRDGISIAIALAGQPGAPKIVLTSTDPSYSDQASQLPGTVFVPKDRLYESHLRELFSSPGT